MSAPSFIPFAGHQQRLQDWLSLPEALAADPSLHDLLGLEGLRHRQVIENRSVERANALRQLEAVVLREGDQLAVDLLARLQRYISSAERLLCDPKNFQVYWQELLAHRTAGYRAFLKQHYSPEAALTDQARARLLEVARERRLPEQNASEIITEFFRPPDDETPIPEEYQNLVKWLKIDCFPDDPLWPTHFDVLGLTDGQQASRQQLEQARAAQEVKISGPAKHPNVEKKRQAEAVQRRLQAAVEALERDPTEYIKKCVKRRSDSFRRTVKEHHKVRGDLAADGHLRLLAGARKRRLSEADAERVIAEVFPSQRAPTPPQPQHAPQPQPQPQRPPQPQTPQSTQTQRPAAPPSPPPAPTTLALNGFDRFGAAATLIFPLVFAPAALGALFGLSTWPGYAATVVAWSAWPLAFLVLPGLAQGQGLTGQNLVKGIQFSFAMLIAVGIVGIADYLLGNNILRPLVGAIFGKTIATAVVGGLAGGVLGFGAGCVFMGDKSTEKAGEHILGWMLPGCAVAGLLSGGVYNLSAGSQFWMLMAIAGSATLALGGLVRGAWTAQAQRTMRGLAQFGAPAAAGAFVCALLLADSSNRPHAVAEGTTGGGGGATQPGSPPDDPVVPSGAGVAVALPTSGGQEGPAPAQAAVLNRRSLEVPGAKPLDLVQVSAGSLVMNSPSGGWGSPSVAEQQPVTLTRPFWIAVTEVTRGQFAAFVRARGDKTTAENLGKAWGNINGQWLEKPGLTWRAPGFEQTDDHPVVCVSWEDANAFCRWLSEVSGEQVRLPTEAEWECSCRAGTNTAYSFGDDANQILKHGNSAHRVWQDQDPFPTTAPVGSLAANGWGLYDLHGNVWEWCADWHGRYAKTAVTDPTGPAYGQYRVFRGGSWDADPVKSQAGFRNVLAPEASANTLGFRIAVGEAVTAPAETPAEPMIARTGGTYELPADAVLALTFNADHVRQIGELQVAEGSTTAPAYGEVKGASAAPGMVDTGLRFDGVEAHVRLDATPSLAAVLENSYTLAAWFRPEAVPTAPDETNATYGILIRPGAHSGLVYDTDGRFALLYFLRDQREPLRCSSDSPQPPGPFYHVAGTCDREQGQLRLYVNGQLAGKQAFDKQVEGYAYGTVPWYVGIAQPGAAQYCWPARGVIDEVSIFRRCLAAEEIAGLYSAGRAGQQPRLRHPLADRFALFPADRQGFRSALQLQVGRSLDLAALHRQVGAQHDVYLASGLLVWKQIGPRGDQAYVYDDGTLVVASRQPLDSLAACDLLRSEATLVVDALRTQADAIPRFDQRLTHDPCFWTDGGGGYKAMAARPAGSLPNPSFTVEVPDVEVHGARIQAWTQGTQYADQHVMLKQNPVPRDGDVGETLRYGSHTLALAGNWLDSLIWIEMATSASDQRLVLKGPSGPFVDQVACLPIGQLQLPEFRAENFAAPARSQPLRLAAPSWTGAYRSAAQLGTRSGILLELDSTLDLKPIRRVLEDSHQVSVHGDFLVWLGPTASTLAAYLFSDGKILLLSRAEFDCLEDRDRLADDAAAVTQAIADVNASVKPYDRGLLYRPRYFARQAGVYHALHIGPQDGVVWNEPAIRLDAPAVRLRETRLALRDATRDYPLPDWATLDGQRMAAEGLQVAQLNPGSHRLAVRGGWRGFNLRLECHTEPGDPAYYAYAEGTYFDEATVCLAADSILVPDPGTVTSPDASSAGRSPAAKELSRPAEQTVRTGKVLEVKGDFVKISLTAGDGLRSGQIVQIEAVPQPAQAGRTLQWINFTVYHVYPNYATVKHSDTAHCQVLPGQAVRLLPE